MPEAQPSLRAVLCAVKNALFFVPAPGTELLKVRVTQLCSTPCDPWTVAWQAPLSMEFSRQGYCRG